MLLPGLRLHPGPAGPTVLTMLSRITLVLLLRSNLRQLHLQTDAFAPATCRNSCIWVLAEQESSEVTELTPVCMDQQGHGAGLICLPLSRIKDELSFSR